jgi:hypothetical protein
MRRRLAFALAVAALALVAVAIAAVAARDRGGIEGIDFVGPDRAAQPLPVLPRTIVARCAGMSASRDVRVLCPRALPAGRWQTVHASLREGRCAYLADLETRPPGSGAAFHALAGGRCGPWPLATTRTRRWPRAVPLAGDLGLVGALPLRPGQAERDQRWVRLAAHGPRDTRVAGHPALLLRAAAYPRGGLHGGHVAVIWNQGGAGYALSLHFSARDDAGDVRHALELLRAARAMSLGDPTA